MPADAEGSGPHSNGPVSLTPHERRLLQVDGAGRALRAAQAAETRWIRDVLGRGGASESKIRLAQDSLRGAARRPSN